MTTGLVIGGGPSGLMAAEAMANKGLKVIVADAMPSVGRKFLMAGKSGLNITKDEQSSKFQQSFFAHGFVKDALTSLSPDQVKKFATELGINIYTGSSGRVFPEQMKSSPLLRAWLGRLNTKDVTLYRRHRWTGDLKNLTFETPNGIVQFETDVVVFALGGGSWRRLGSDGQWAQSFEQQGIEINPFKPSNCGFEVNWSTHMAKHFGQPIKSCSVTIGDQTIKGEFAVSQNGLEGSAMYALSRQLMDTLEFKLDLVPDLDVQTVQTRLAKGKGKASLNNQLRKSLKLDPAKIALLREFTPDLATDVTILAKQIKCVAVKVAGTYPMDGAISTTGGVSGQSLNEQLMLSDFPGIFCAGEMLDWDAPTGGYLISGCLASGMWAGQYAADYALATAR